MVRQASHSEPAGGFTILVTTRPFEALRVEVSTGELTLRIERTGLAMPLIGMLLVSVVLGLLIQLVFPHLPWRSPGVLSKIPSIAWCVSGFMLAALLAIFSINVARTRPGHVLLGLVRSPGGLRCKHAAGETWLAVPTITIGPDRDLIADLHRRGVAVNPLCRDVVLLHDATTRVVIYSAGTREARQRVFVPIEQWLRS